MKKKYIQPNVSVSFVVVESLMLGGSGVGRDEGDDWGTCSKKHDFTDDSFDTAWPKDKSPWETDD